MRTYAYITTETCRRMDACLPGDYVGREETPVSRHGDYAPWRHGKRETIRRFGLPGYGGRAARAVAELLGWEE